MEEIFNYFNGNIDAITGFGILITFLVSVISLFITVRNNKAVHYVNSITKSRIEWIQKVRDLTSEFIAATNIFNNYHYKRDYEKSGIHLSKCQKLCSEITLLLNSCDQKDGEIISICNDILENYHSYSDEIHNLKVDSKGYFIEPDESIKHKEKVEEKIKELLNKIQIYLKAEWNRVKHESQGKIYYPEIQAFDYMELEQMHKDSTYKPKRFKRYFKIIWIRLYKIILSPKTVFICVVLLITLIILYLFKII